MSSLASGMERLMSMDDEAVHVRPGGSITLPLGLLGSLGWLLGISLWAELGMYRGRTAREARHRYAYVCRQVEGSSLHAKERTADKVNGDACFLPCCGV